MSLEPRKADQVIDDGRWMRRQIERRVGLRARNQIVDSRAPAGDCERAAVAGGWDGVGLLRCCVGV